MLSVRFIRHGESLANAGGITSETRLIPLTDRGWAQVRELSQSFTAPPSLIIASPYLRAHDSARPTIERFPHVPVEIWSVQEFTYLAKERCRNTTMIQRTPWTAEFWDSADPHYVDGDGAESYREFVGRVRAILDRLAMLAVPSAAIFSHGMFMKALHWEIENRNCTIDPGTMRAFRAFHLAAPIANARGFTARWDGERWRVGV